MVGVRTCGGRHVWRWGVPDIVLRLWLGWWREIRAKGICCGVKKPRVPRPRRAWPGVSGMVGPCWAIRVSFRNEGVCH